MLRYIKVGLIAISLNATIVPGVSFAHHGVNGQFDLSQTLEKTGTITRVRFVNPHSYVYFDVTNDAGEIENWRCELRSGSLLKRKGWSTEMFADGSEITIQGSPARTEPTTCYTESITFEDGTVVNRYDALDQDGNVMVPPREPTIADGSPNINGNWGMPVPDGPPSGPRPARYQMTEAGIAAGAGFTEADNPRFQCQATNIILDWWFDQMVNKIDQTEDEIVLTYGFMDMVRTIYMNMDGHPDNLTPSRTGHSIGRWEDNVLVVDTVGFDEGFIMAPGGRTTDSVRNSEALRVIERFTIGEDGTSITRDYTLEDPEYLAESYTGSDMVVLMTSAFEPYSCNDLTVESN